MIHKKLCSVVLSMATISAVLAGCGIFGGGQSSSAPAQSDSASVSSQAAVSSAPQESSAPAQSAASSEAAVSSSGNQESDSLPGAVGKIETNDKDFNKKFAANPIDKAYVAESVNALSNQDMIGIADKYAGLWQKEINSAYGKVTKLATGSELDEIRADQNDWLTDKKAALAKISADAQAAGGTLAQVSEATAVMNFYRSRAVEVYRQLYSYQKDYSYAYSK